MTVSAPAPMSVLEQVVAPAAALHAALDTGLLAAIASAGTTSAAAARLCHLDVHRARVLLEVLADAGLADRQGDRYSAHPNMERLGELAMSSLRDLSGAVMANRPATGPRRDLYQHMVTLLGELMAPVAHVVATLLARPEAHVVDLGAGAAPWSLAILAREPSARLTAVDLPDVAAVTREAITAAGHDARATVVAADILTDPLPTGADIVLLAQVCHLFDRQTAAALVRRAAASINDRGCLAIIEPIDNPDRPDLRPALRRYEIGLFTRTSRGRVHELDAMTAWCRTNGLEHIELHRPSPASPVCLLVARSEAPGTGTDAPLKGQEAP